MTEKALEIDKTPVHDVQLLKRNAVGTIGVIFMAVATAAPITAMVGNVPIAVGSGNGSHAPAGYIVATVVLGLFAIGYATMAKHITSTGAFYGYISHGLGQIVGMASGALITMAYVVFEASLIGIFSFFFQNLLSSQLGVHIHWIVPALIMLALNAILPYFDINLTAKVLGRLPGHRDRHALAGRAGGARRTAAVPRVSRFRRRSTPSVRSSRPPGSPARAPAWACSSRSGRGSASSRPRCTARSPATRSESSRGPP